MSNERPKYPAIASVAPEIYRPLWSVMIPNYNCIDYLKPTLLSLLAQAPSHELMQIEVVDNCSTDGDVEALVKELGRGRISFHRQPQNIGAIANFNACIERSVGQLIHILHSDDIVLPGFYETFQQAFEQEPTVGAAFCRSIYINEHGAQTALSPSNRARAGVFPNLLECLAKSHLILSPAFVVKREVYERLGGFHPDLFHAGDTEMYMRIASQYSVWYEPTPLACYRKHTQSQTFSLIKSGANAANVRLAIAISASYLSDRTISQLQEFEAINTFREVCWQLVKLDFATAYIQMQEALKFSNSPKTLLKMVVFLANLMLTVGTSRLQTMVFKFARPKISSSN
ncbi:glycosyltransferase [Aliterella atlantica]|uniref:Glycosyltransferase 2-like domain-containing protein n=1 Tax=Aliterella atlantica CENA595 TaxID=1618023 RepID=A0A0D8ZX76_9CYAN|nr:glycosyltransferase [Aliterella atlantica]KJH73054.1 hypothetical protein UH38_03015 [Aliterella atlantica CENA595]